MSQTIHYQQILLRKPIRHAPVDDNLITALTNDSMDRISNLPDMEMLFDEGWEALAVHPDAK